MVDVDISAKQKEGGKRCREGKERITDGSKRCGMSSEKRFEVAVLGEGEELVART